MTDQEWKDPLKHLRYPVEIRRQDDKFMVIALGATTDRYVAIKEGRVPPEVLASPGKMGKLLCRQITEAQIDQCARECRNLWGPIWDQIWQEVWEDNEEAMHEEMCKALVEYSLADRRERND